jgi:YrhK-like protein
MALCFAAGSTCFLIGPFPGYVDLVGPEAAAVTFFVGSILFTAGGALQSWLSYRQGSAERWSALIQSAGTLFFNVTTYQALSTTLSNPDYDKLVWRPDAFGSVCFLVSGVIAYRAAPRQWQPTVNLLGCVFFGVAAVAGYLVPSKGSILDLAAANWNTSLGAACFLACAVATWRAAHPVRGR